MTEHTKVNMWVGENGTYKVPKAITWLGEEANSRLGLPTSDDWRMFELFSKSPYFKIVEEWGKWKDSQCA